MPGKKVRHGNGVEIFHTAENKVICKYEGSWDRDRKHGEGTIYFSDGATYSGQLQFDVIHGHGVFTWANGDKYEGS